MFRFGFDHHTRHFTLRNAYHSARASQLAYAEPDVIERVVMRDWQCRGFAFLDEDQTQAFVASNARSVVVCFRGTETDRMEDWITDVDMELVPGPLEGKVHVGFYDALSKVWELIDDRVKRYDRDGAKALWITGHSLGGALATLSAARWIEHGRPVQGLYTFGQPRAGDRAFARNFNFRFRPYAFRMVNDADLVTRIPPRAFGYSHVGTFRYFPTTGEVDGDMGWWWGFLERWQVRIEDVFRWSDSLLAPHRMSAYLECLEQAIRRQRIALPTEQDMNRFLRAAVSGRKCA